MKVLIVARHFAPENTIGAIRVTKFAKYLARLGHQVTVYAMTPLIKLEDDILKADAEGLRTFHLDNGPLYRAIHGFFSARDKTRGTGNVGTAASGTATAPKKSTKLLKMVLNTMYKIMWIWSDLDFAAHYKKCTRTDRECYDVAFGSWNTDAALRIARDMKRRGRARAFAADFRDACLSVWPELTKNKDTDRLLKGVYADADLVTLAFPELMKRNRVPAHVPHAVLYNGFDPEDLRFVPRPAPLHDGRLHLAYLGQIYEGKQDFRPLFSACRALMDAGALPEDGICLHYAGQSFERLFAQAEEFDLCSMLDHRGFLPRQEALSMELGADLLLFAAWNSPEQPAIFPAKFLEYMMMEKPVLALISGPLPDSLPRQVMEKTRLGFVYEGCDPDSLQALQEHLLACYRCKKAGQPLPFTPDAQAVSAYAYPTLAGQLSALLKDAAERKQA